MPRLIDARHDFSPAGMAEQPGVSVLVREGFVVGHCDEFKVPLWVAQKWTRDDLEDSQGPSHPRPFKPDPELPDYAQAGTDYEYSSSQMQRGHMARHQDNAAYGRDNSDAGCLMSNIAPQHKHLNPESWLALENAHRNVVSGEEHDIDTLWVISGTIFPDGQPRGLIGNDIGIPDACYKVIAWRDAEERLQARGYILTQDDHETNPADYLRSVDDIEQVTGLDFLHELPDDLEADVEAHVPRTMWSSEQ
jgi:endonuclease G